MIRFLCAILTLSAALQMPAAITLAADSDVDTKAREFNLKVHKIGVLTAELQDLAYKKLLLTSYLHSSSRKEAFRKEAVRRKMLEAAHHGSQMTLNTVASIVLNGVATRYSKTATSLRRAAIGLVALAGSWTGFGYSVFNGMKLVADARDINNMRDFDKMSDEELAQFSAVLDVKAATVSAEREALRQEILK